MATYRFMATSIVTGQLLMADIPVTVSMFNTQINGTGQLTGVLNLRSDMSIDYQQAALTAIEPFKAMFWVLCDNIPVWGGPVTSWTSQSAQAMTLSFTASTVDAIFAYRIFDVNTDFVSEDVGLIFWELINYAVTKNEPYSRIANLNYANKGLAITESDFTTNVSDFQDVQSLWNSLVTATDVEYYFQTSWNGTSTAPQVSLVLGQTVGRPLSATNMSLTYPSKSVVDYAYIQGSSSIANHVIATGTSGATNATYFESDSTSGFDVDSLESGHILLEQSYSMPNSVSSQADVNLGANTQVKTVSPLSQLTPGIILGAGAFPLPYEIQLGDWVSFSATSPLHPPKSPGGPGLVLIGRVSNIQVVPAAAGQVEQTTLTLGQIDRLV